MYNGVKAMIAKEKELASGGGAATQASSADVQVGAHLKKAEELTGFPVFPAGTKSLVSKHCTRDVWEQLKDKKDSAGFTFKEAIFSGA